MRQTLTAPRSQRHIRSTSTSTARHTPDTAKGTGTGMTMTHAAVGIPVAPNTIALPHGRTAAQLHIDTDARTHVTQDAYKQYRYGGAESGDVQYDQVQTHHAPCPVRASDLRDLKPGQPPWRSAYRALLTGGDQPRCAPNDLDTAAMMVQRIRDAQDRGGWTSNERSRLSRMRRAWERRLRGQDARYLVAGNRPGRLTVQEQARVHCLRRVIDGQTGGLDGHRTDTVVNLSTFTGLDHAHLG